VRLHLVVVEAVAMEVGCHLQHALPQSAQVQANVCEAAPKANALTEVAAGSDLHVGQHAQRDPSR